jgi:hypothetical protein
VQSALPSVLPFFFLPTMRHAKLDFYFILILLSSGLFLLPSNKDKVSPDALTPPPLLLHSPVIYLP